MIYWDMLQSGDSPKALVNTFFSRDNELKTKYRLGWALLVSCKPICSEAISIAYKGKHFIYDDISHSD